MNIKGIFLLKEKGFPLMENLFLFRNFDEILESHLDCYGERKIWSIRAFDDRTKITDSPYKTKSPWFRGLGKDELKESLARLNKDMDKYAIPIENRIFFICRGFFDKDVEFSGHAYKDKDYVYIDILEGNRPSGKDWTPDFSFKIGIINSRPVLSSVESGKYRGYVVRILNDILKFDDTAYLDFTKFKEGYFFYHDLSMH